MGLLSERRRAMGGKALPYDAEIEYLEASAESGGQPFIDTGYVPTEQDMMIHAVVTFMGYKNNIAYPMWYGAYGIASGMESVASVYRVMQGANNSVLFCTNGGTIYSPESFTFSGVTPGDYDILFDGLDATINGRQYKFAEKPGLVENTVTMKLFSSVISNGNIAYLRFRSFKMAKSGATVLDMIPVRKGDEGFMYDRVSGRLMGNSGTGRFILGADVAKQSVNNQLVKRGGGS